MTDWTYFKTRVPGKWVLAGEHTVLRGGGAVALAHPEFSLELEFTPDAGRQGGRLQVEPESARAVISELLDAIEDDRQVKDLSFPRPAGLLEIRSTIPVGAGLGSSAALCVAIARWVADPLGLQPGDLFEFAKALEHRFHGRSSGMDVAVTLLGEPISFSVEKGAKSLGIKRLPHFTFHDTGLRARTSDCVLKVEKFREEFPLEAMQVDELMKLAARKATEGLILYSAGTEAGQSRDALRLVADAMSSAQEAFYRWLLIPGEGRRMEAELLEKGALAVKMTGAGGGGFLVALWPEPQG